jgi:hypothetical protein
MKEDPKEQNYSSSDSARAQNANFSVTLHIDRNSHRGSVEVKARPPVPLDPPANKSTS